MIQQQTINFNGPVNQNTINRYAESEKDESKTGKYTVSLTDTQKTILKELCFEANIGVSTFIGQALENYLKLYPFRDKLHRHGDFLVETLKRLS